MKAASARLPEKRRDTISTVCEGLERKLRADPSAATEGVDMADASLRVALDAFGLTALGHDFRAREYGRCEALEVRGRGAGGLAGRQAGERAGGPAGGQQHRAPFLWIAYCLQLSRVGQSLRSSLPAGMSGQPHSRAGYQACPDRHSSVRLHH